MILGTLQLKPGATQSIAPHLRTLGRGPSIDVHFVSEGELERLIAPPTFLYMELTDVGCHVAMPHTDDEQRGHVFLLVVLEGFHLVGDAKSVKDGISYPACGPGDVLLVEPGTPHWALPASLDTGETTHTSPHFLALSFTVARRHLGAALTDLFASNRGRIHDAWLSHPIWEREPRQRRMKPYGGVAPLKALAEQVGRGPAAREAAA